MIVIKDDKIEMKLQKSRKKVDSKHLSLIKGYLSSNTCKIFTLKDI